MMKLIPFLSRAILFPSSLISRGNVTVPIMVSVVMKAATAVIDAPLSRSDAAKGNESSAGICRTPPISATSSTPPSPDCSPTNLEISLGGTNAKSKPIRIMMIRMVGRIRKNELAATTTDCLAFALFLAKAKTRALIAKVFMRIAVELILITYSL